MNYSSSDSRGSGVAIGVGLVAALITVLAIGLVLISSGRKAEMEELRLQDERAMQAARTRLENAERAEASASPATPTVQPDEPELSAAKKSAVPVAAPEAEEAKPPAEANEPAGKQQKAFVLEAGWGNNINQLNEMLKEGWRVVQTCSMGGADPKTSRCLVILEKP